MTEHSHVTDIDFVKGGTPYMPIRDISWPEHPEVKTKKTFSRSFNREIHRFVGNLLGSKALKKKYGLPERGFTYEMNTKSLSLLADEEYETHFANVKDFQDNEYLERLAKQMVYNLAKEKGLIEDTLDANKTFLF